MKLVDYVPVIKLYHKYFSGPDDWKCRLENSFRNNDIIGYKVIGRYFGRLVVIDSCKEELWILPKLRTGAELVEFGWIYWAIGITKNVYYPV